MILRISPGFAEKLVRSYFIWATKVDNSIVRSALTKGSFACEKDTIKQLASKKETGILNMIGVWKIE